MEIGNYLLGTTKLKHALLYHIPSKCTSPSNILTADFVCLSVCVFACVCVVCYVYMCVCGIYVHIVQLCVCVSVCIQVPVRA